jgi:hypothetical protein
VPDSEALRRLLALLFVAALSAASAAEARTYYPNCATHLRYRPHVISVFCADGGMQVKRLHWSKWAADEARGRSRYSYVNDCTPNCAEGHFERFRVRLVLHRARTCSRNDKQVFTRMTVIFVGHKWSGPRKFTQRLFCD